METATEMTQGQKQFQQEKADKIRKEFESSQERAQHRQNQKLDQVAADKQAYLKNIYDSAQFILRRAKADFDEYMQKASAAREVIQTQEGQIQKALADGYIVPTPPTPEVKVEHKVAPPAPALVAPLDLGKIQTELNSKAQKEAAEEEARRYTTCPVCSERIFKTQLLLVHKKKSNRFMCVPSKDPRALVRAGVATTLAQAEAIYSEAGISPDTLRDIADLLEDSGTQKGF